MNVLFWNDTLEVGGGEVWALQTALHLRGKGHAVSFACPAGSWTEEQAGVNGVAHFDYFFEPAFCSNFLWQAESFLREHRIDVVLCTVMGNRTEAALLSGLVRKVGRGAVLLRVGAAPWSGLSAAHLGHGMEDVVRGTIVNSAFLKRQILNRFPEIPPERVEVLHNGVDTRALDPARSRNRARMRLSIGVPEGSLLLSAVGRLTEVKNHPFLLRTMATVFPQVPEAMLALVGEGGQLERLQTLSRELNIADRVRFVGHRNDIPEILGATDLLVHTSLMEGCPNVVLEAMAMAKPVIATDVGGTPELVVHGETGLLVPSGDEEALSQAILSLALDRAERLRLGEAGRGRALRLFDRDAQVGKLETFLGRMAGGWRKQGAGSRFPLPAGAGLAPEPPEMFFRRRCHRRYPFRPPVQPLKAREGS